jgi:hypothetical protein
MYGSMVAPAHLEVDTQQLYRSVHCGGGRWVKESFLKAATCTMDVIYCGGAKPYMCAPTPICMMNC